MARTLASIQRVSEIIPIEGADRIELAKVLGWQVVVKKGQFKPNDLCVYIQRLLPVVRSCIAAPFLLFHNPMLDALVFVGI